MKSKKFARRRGSSVSDAGQWQSAETPRIGLPLVGWKNLTRKFQDADCTGRGGDAESYGGCDLLPVQVGINALNSRIVRGVSDIQETRQPNGTMAQCNARATNLGLAVQVAEKMSKSRY